MDVRQADLMTLDRALMRLRRFLTAPRTLEDDGRSVDLSTLLVLDSLPPEGESVREIALRLDVAPSTASRFVTRAAEAAMVVRAPSAGDARESVITPTDAGRRLQAGAIEYRLTQLRDIVDGWDDDDVHSLAAGLARFASEATGAQ